MVTYEKIEQGYSVKLNGVRVGLIRDLRKLRKHHKIWSVEVVGFRSEIFSTFKISRQNEFQKLCEAKKAIEEHYKDLIRVD